MIRLTISTVWLTGLPTWARVGTDARAANAPTSPKQQQHSMRGMLERRTLFGLFQPTVDNIRSAN